MEQEKEKEQGEGDSGDAAQGVIEVQMVDSAGGESP